MALRYARPTFGEIIAEALDDLNREAALAELPPETWINWILRAEQHVCSRVEIGEEYILRLDAGVKHYPVQDRPPITSASLTSPIVMGCTAHGLSTGDVVFLDGVGGNTASNGRKRVKSALTADTFSIQRFSRVEGATNASPIVLKLTGHEFATGDSVTVAGVLGNTAANGTFTCTKVDANHISLDSSTGNADYTSGGTVVADTTGDAAYTGGGRVWRENELPSHVRWLRWGQHTTGGILYPVAVRSYDILRAREEHANPVENGYASSPEEMALVLRSGQRWLQVALPPAADKDLTIQGILGVVPEDYRHMVASQSIHLDAHTTPAILSYVKSKALIRLSSSNPSFVEAALFHAGEVDHHIALLRADAFVHSGATTKIEYT